MTGRNVVPFAAPAPDPSAQPHNTEAERALLGALLIQNEAMGEVASLVQAEHFFWADHQEVYACIAALIASGRPATPITVKGYLKQAEIGGQPTMHFLAAIATEATTTVNASGYAAVVRDFAARRRLLRTGADLMARALSDPAETTAQDLIDAVETDLLDVRAEVPQTHLAGMTAGEGGLWLIDRIQQLRSGLLQSTAVSTGIPDLDKATSGGFGRGQLWLMAGRPGMGKAQPLSARVHTPQGWRLMGEMALGTAVSSVDGALSRVEGVFDQGVRLVYRVRLSDGRETRCCAEHLWEVDHRSWPATRVIETARLIEMLGKVRYRNRLSIRMHAGEIGRRADLPLHPWLLGVILGDGGPSTDTVRLSLPDAEIHARVGALLPAGYRLSQQDGIDYLITTTEGGRNCVKAILAELGLMGTRSETKSVPRIYLDGDRAQRLALLQGLLDTDGWVERQGSVRFSSASPQLAADVVEIARSLGFWAKASVKAAHLGSHAAGRVRMQDAHQVCITGERIADVFTLPRKADRLKNRSWFRSLTIESITPDGEEACRCISVSHPTHLYVTDQHVVTHNTVVMSSLSRRAAKHAGVLVFQLEVTRDQQFARYMADLCYVANNPLTFGQIMQGTGLNDEDLWRLSDAQKRLSRLHLKVECEPGITLAQIVFAVKAEKKRLAKQGVELGVVFLDYLKFIRAGDRYKGNRVLEIGEISGALKALAKAEDICIVLLAQLNRGVEAQGREDKRPTMADLRDSGELEQDADVVVLLYRDAYYLEKSVKAKNDPEMIERLLDRQNALELILGKNRAGPTPTLDLWCDVAASSIAQHARGPL